MKTVLVLMCLAIIAASTVDGSIPSDLPKFQAYRLLAGEHPLITLGKYFTSIDTVFTGKNFYLNVSLAWQTDDDDCVIVSLPTDKVDLRFANQPLKAPTISFLWRNAFCRCSTPQEIADNLVVRAEIYCSFEYLPYLFKSPLSELFD